MTHWVYIMLPMAETEVLINHINLYADRGIFDILQFLEPFFRKGCVCLKQFWAHTDSKRVSVVFGMA